MKIPKIISNSAVYSVVAFFQKCIMFFLLPLYTHYLTPEDYGVMNVVISLTTFLSIFILFSLTSTATRFYYMNRDISYAKKLWGTLILLVLINSVVIGSLIIIFHRYVIDFAIGDIPFYPFVFVGMLNTIVSPLYLFFQSYLQTIQDGKRYAVNALLHFTIQVALTVFFIAYFKLGVIGVLLANLITTALFFIYSFFFFLRLKLKWRIDKEIASSAVKYATPLLPHHLFAWSSGTIDKLMLNSLSSTSTTGLYSAAQQFGNIVGMIEVGVNRAYTPWFYDKISKGSTAVIPKLSQILVLGYCTLALAISLFSREVLNFMVAESYRSVWVYIPFFCYAQVFQGVYYIFSNYLFYEKPKNVFYCTFISALVIVVFNFMLIPRIGIAGPVVSSAIAMVIRSIVCIYMARKTECYVKTDILSLIIPIILFFALSMLTFPLAKLNLFVSVLLKCLIILLVVLSLLKKYSFEFKSLFIK